MSDVIDMGKRRLQREAESKTLWQCRDCGQHEFLLATDGAVVCMACQEVVEDLRVTDLDERQ